MSIYGQKTTNGYGTIIQLNGAVKASESENYLTQYKTGLEVLWSRRLFHWWETRDVMSFSLSSSSSSIPAVVAQNGYSFYYSSYNTFIISGVLSLFANFRHYLPSTNANVHVDAHYDLSAGLKLVLAKNKVQITLSGDDLFRSSTEIDRLYFSSFTQYVRHLL